MLAENAERDGSLETNFRHKLEGGAENALMTFSRQAEC